MRPLILAALLLAPIAAHADPVPHGMVLIPDALAGFAHSYIAQHTDQAATQIAGALAACMASSSGHPWKPDGCPTVTEALHPAPPVKPHAMPAPVTTPAAP